MQILIWLALGIVLGLWVVPHRWKKVGSVLQAVAMTAALFCMGVSLGAQPDLWENLREAGASSAVIAVATIAGSAAVVWLFEKRVLSRKKTQVSPKGLSAKKPGVLKVGEEESL